MIAKEKKDLENALDSLRAQKDEEIQKLKQMLLPPDPQDSSAALPELKVIEELRG